MTMPKKEWVSFFTSSLFIFRHPRLSVLSILLVAVTAFLTELGYHEAILFVDGMIGHFFQTAPIHQGFLGWGAFIGWFIAKYLFIFVSRTCAFYLAFLSAYCLTTPGYILLSASVEGIVGHKDKGTSRLTPQTILLDF